MGRNDKRLFVGALCGIVFSLALPILLRHHMHWPVVWPWLDIVLTVAYLVAAGLGCWGVWLAIVGTWLSPEMRIVFNDDGTATPAEEFFRVETIA